jgi:hypothetical protein
MSCFVLRPGSPPRPSALRSPGACLLRCQRTPNRRRQGGGQRRLASPTFADHRFRRRGQSQQWTADRDHLQGAGKQCERQRSVVLAAANAERVGCGSPRTKHRTYAAVVRKLPTLPRPDYDRNHKAGSPDDSFGQRRLGGPRGRCGHRLQAGRPIGSRQQPLVLPE